MIAPEKLQEIKDLVVIIMVGNPLPIEKQMDELGVRWVTHEELTVDDELGLCKDPQWFALQRERIIDGVDDFEDERSKEIYTECLAHRIAYPLAEKTYEELCSMPEYFGTDVLPLSDGETYVDCGAYDGDTIVEFIGQTGGYRHIYGFELDKNNFQKCAARFFSDHDITLFQKGVWDQNTTVSYSLGDGVHESGASASIHKADIATKKNSGEVVRLDDVLEGVPVSLIKIDVEGAEARALKGAETLIKTCKPKLAVCVYHKTSDFWELPRYIKQLDESYRIYLRHHSQSSGMETVLYAL